MTKKQDDMLPPIPKKRKNVQDLTLKNKRIIDVNMNSIKSRLNSLEARVSKLEDK